MTGIYNRHTGSQLSAEQMARAIEEQPRRRIDDPPVLSEMLTSEQIEILNRATREVQDRTNGLLHSKAVERPAAEAQV